MRYNTERGRDAATWGSSWIEMDLVNTHNHDHSGVGRDRREVLKALRTSDAPVAGPRAEGLAETDQIVLASFYNPQVCRRFRRSLRNAGVASSTRRDGMKAAVAVSLADREKAHEVLARHREKVVDTRPRGIRRDFDFAIFGGLLGATVGVASLTYSVNPLARLGIWGGFVASGILLGHLLDRCRRRYRFTGRFQLTVADMFVFVAAIAIVISFWRFLVQ